MKEETKEQQGTIIIYKDKVTEVRLVEAEEDDDGNIIKDWATRRNETSL